MAPPLRPADRLILFLRRPGADLEFNSRPDLPVNTDGWQPAKSPGPSHLVDLGWTENQMRDQIGAVLQLRRSLDEALGFAEPAARAKKLAELVRSGNLLATLSALRHLESGGADAAAYLEELLADPAMLR